MASPARERVFGSPELFGVILSFLPLHTLLHIQGVSQTWQDFVQSSSVIQQALFFKPKTISRKPFPPQRDGQSPAIEDLGLNPLLLKLFPAFFEHYLFTKRDHTPVVSPSRPNQTITYATSTVEADQLKACYEPFAVPDPVKKSPESDKVVQNDDADSRRFSKRRRRLIKGEHDTNPPVKFDAITGRGASWRRMLPTQLPIKSLLVVQARSHRSTSLSTAVIRGDGPDGAITMGQLVDICADLVICTHRVSGFTVDFEGQLQPPDTWRFSHIDKQAKKALERLEEGMAVIWTYWVPQCTIGWNMGGREYMCEEMKECWPRSDQWQEVRLTDDADSDGGD